MTPTQRLRPEMVSRGTIGSIASLCSALDITVAEFHKALALPATARYNGKLLTKKDGGDRHVFSPVPVIRKIQSRINRRIFANQNIIRWPDYLFGSIPNSEDKSVAVVRKDFVNCAQQHCGAKSILTVDVKDFFDNIHLDRVREIFGKFLLYPDDVADAIANVCCKDGHVVQGALTSSYIATLCLYNIEEGLVLKLRRKNLTYTRLVDDITISSKINNYDFAYALGQTEKMLGEAELPLNTGKTKIQRASMKPLIVHGLRVDFDKPRLPPEEPKKIRAAVNNLQKSASTPGYRASRAYRREFNRCMGRVNKLRRVGHTQHEELMCKLRRVLPLPSHADIPKAEARVSRLEQDALKPGYKDTHWFYKRYYVTSERLKILQRSFPRISQELRERLRKIKPEKRHE